MFSLKSMTKLEDLTVVTDPRDLKVPKCEIFDLFDFNYFYVMKSL